MKTSDFDFNLPPELIAQVPMDVRDQSRMMVVNRKAGTIEHRQVCDIVEYLNAGDLLVVNNTKVFPARIFGHRADTGGKVELLLLEQVATDGELITDWNSFFKGSSGAAVGMQLTLADGHVAATIVESMGGGRIRIRLESDKPLAAILAKHGAPPVPPYIKRDRDLNGERIRMDRERYQTVFAKETGAVAAPTAGLHFTPELLDSMADAGIKKAELTLHVGPGTFQPVKVDILEDHRMEAERYNISEQSAAMIQETQAGAGRIVAVGSTSVRTLETAAVMYGEVVACEGRSEIFIYPPYDFKVVDILLTNFHLPCSTLLMMISAFAGQELVKRAYDEAVAEKYRFYSYGDCMLII